MKKFLVTGIFLMGTINGCLAQVVRPLHNSHVVYKPFDIGLSLTSYIDSGRPGLFITMRMVLLLLSTYISQHLQ